MDIGVLRRDGRTDPFFDGTAAGRLVVRRCAACDRWLAPDAGGCPGCGDEDPGWAEASGAATLVTWTVTHGRPAGDGTVPPPAVLALVELAEGPWLHARLDAADPAALRGRLREGLPLTAVFVPAEQGEAHLLFRPEQGD
ncbi:Zn-ribbon domain-containing OB-fold protein [Spirillospora sp. NBC_01491]|uniref:Zn-ribbon domain-containing OB-fold protein n=1 Tax=Spirillospora sp. NBC_01491 TaxID=2976007 RepID=UPI002E327555|nr:OB-fold domain-containing protein [Spirillospora sp. NBC_01491]